MALKEEACRFPICHNMFQINVNNGKLSLQLYQRTADIFLGVPFNIASYALLAMIIAQITGHKLGEFIHTFGDVHIYEDHFAAAREQLEREPRNFPKVKLDPSIKEIDDFAPDKVELVGYDSYGAIKAPLSPTGGIVTDSWKKFVQDAKNKK
jgi:thymidylate synthase